MILLPSLTASRLKAFAELETEKNKYKAKDKVEVTIYRMPQQGDASQEYLTWRLFWVKIKDSRFLSFAALRCR